MNNLLQFKHPQWGSIIGHETDIRLAVLKDELKNWEYTEEQENDEDETKTWNAHWNESEPEIDYQGLVLSVGIRSTFFSSFTFE